MKLVFNDEQYSYQLLRLLGESVSGASDIGEVLATAKKIKEGDFESWCTEWTKTAKRIHKFAEDCYAKNFLVSAKEAYLRASNYYRTAEFYLHTNFNDPRIKELYDASLKCFSYVIKLNKPKIEEIQIAFEDIKLPAHFYKAKDSSEALPTLIGMTGYDGTKEEMYGLAMSAVERGINCIVFEGPGQGEVVRRQGSVFRHDYEKVVSKIVDYIFTRNDVNRKHIALLGESFGGYLAPRAAAFEPRLAACIANGGVYDFQGFRRPPHLSREEYFKYNRENQNESNKLMEQMMKQSIEMKWAVSHGMYVFGAKSPAEYMDKCEPYFLSGVAEKIQCPTLVIDTENEHFFTGQAKDLFNALTCEKEFMLFTEEETAAEHCQVGAKYISTERIFNWLEGIFRR